MYSSKLIVAAAAAISVFGATGAFAQGTSTGTVQQPGTTPQTQEQMQQQTTPLNQGSTNLPATDSTMNRVDGTGTTGTTRTTGTTGTDSMATDSRPVTSERVARADRN